VADESRDTELHLRHHLSLRRLDIVGSALQMVIPWLGLCFISYMVYRAVNTLAGRATQAEIGVTVIGNLKLNEALAWLLSGLFGGYGLNERRLRRKHVAQTATQIAELEARIDPNRTSSGLTHQGTTRPRDR
jgi:hypothetical protein